jgi:predicted small secreted protein
MTRTLRTALALGALASLAACNTIEGIGRDLGALGDAMTGSSERARSDSSSNRKIEDDGTLLGGPPKPPAGSQRP